MQDSSIIRDGTPRPGHGILVVGFGIAVAMWAVGYVGRLPSIVLPSSLILILLLFCPLFGGALLARRGRLDWRSGFGAGLVSGLINLLVLGSFLGGEEPDRLIPSALWWIPGSILLSALLGACGAWIGSRSRHDGDPFEDWPAAFVRVAMAATFLLLAVGGLVTSADAGLAVVDWPRSFGYNMFLYPLSRMTGGIYYEHAHRLFGALVGLTTLVLAFYLQRFESRRWVRLLGWSCLLLVILQGLLGGIRVTERSVALAMLHGVLGQLFFATLVALATFTSAIWRGETLPLRRASVRTDRALGLLLVAAILIQLVLGAAQRHLSQLLMVHLMTGVALVTPLALNVGMRSWGLNNGRPQLQRLGLALVGAVCLQLLLGIGAFAFSGPPDATNVPGGWALALPTAHQWLGAMVLALGVGLSCLSFRLLAPEQAA